MEDNELNFNEEPFMSNWELVASRKLIMGILEL